MHLAIACFLQILDDGWLLERPPAVPQERSRNHAGGKYDEPQRESAPIPRRTPRRTSVAKCRGDRGRHKASTPNPAAGLLKVRNAKRSLTALRLKPWPRLFLPTPAHV